MAIMQAKQAESLPEHFLPEPEGDELIILKEANNAFQRFG
jgi:hypothetical protein